MNKGILLSIPILLPGLGGLWLLVRPVKDRVGRHWYLLSILALNVVSVVMVAGLLQKRLVLFHLTEQLPLFLQADGLSLLFCLLAAVMFLLVGLYSFDYMKHESNESRFYAFYLLALGAINGLGFSGNLITLYLFFEMLTLLTVPLVLHSMTKESIAASFQYLFYSIGGASLALIGMFFLYAYGGTLDFLPGGVLDPARVSGNETALLVVTLLTIIGFGAKAGMFPLHAWLPAAHPVAPAPASAVLSGVITKAGVFAVFRFVFYSVGAEFVRGTWVQYTWIVLCLITVLMGSTLAYKEPLFKKRLAYSSVSQVSYALFGLATLSVWGLVGSLLQMVFHSIVKDALFLVSGAMISKTGKTAVSQLRGIGREMPFVLWCFTLASFALIGIPPTSGFVGKWYLAMGALSADIGVFAWLGPVILLVSALLAAGYLLPISIQGFFPGLDHPPGDKIAVPWTMKAPLGVLAAAAVLFGIFPNGIISYVSSLAQAIL